MESLAASLKEMGKGKWAYNGKLEGVVAVNINLEGLTSGHTCHEGVIPLAGSENSQAEGIDEAWVIFISTRVKVTGIGSDWELGSVTDSTLQPTVLVVLERSGDLWDAMFLCLVSE